MLMLTLTEFAVFTNGAADNQAVYKQLQAEKVAKFNAPVFLENKQKIGSIDEIFGPINEVVRPPCLIALLLWFLAVRCINGSHHL